MYYATHAALVPPSHVLLENFENFVPKPRVFMFQNPGFTTSQTQGFHVSKPRVYKVSSLCKTRF
jgi:hypothetical protein